MNKEFTRLLAASSFGDPEVQAVIRSYRKKRAANLREYRHALGHCDDEALAGEMAQVARALPQAVVPPRASYLVARLRACRHEALDVRDWDIADDRVKWEMDTLTVPCPECGYRWGLCPPEESCCFDREILRARPVPRSLAAWGRHGPGGPGT